MKAHGYRALRRRGLQILYYYTPLFLPSDKEEGRSLSDLPFSVLDRLSKLPTTESTADFPLVYRLELVTPLSEPCRLWGVTVAISKVDGLLVAFVYVILMLSIHTEIISLTTDSKWEAKHIQE